MQNIVTLGEINDALKIAAVTAAQLADMGFAALANKPICEGLPPEESRRLRNAKLYPAESIGQIRVALAQRLAAPATMQASVSNATCQAAPAAVAVPDELIRAAKQALACMDGLQQHLGRAVCQVEADALRAALAATPAAAPGKLGDDMQMRCRKCGEQVKIEFNSARIVTHNPHTGKPRDARDVESDPEGKLIVAPGPLFAAAAPVVLAEPWGYLVEGRIFIGRLLPQHVNSMVESEGFQPIKLFTEQQVRALLATATGLPAQAVEMPDFDLRTSKGGRGFVAWYFASVLQRYDYQNYITNKLAADFACDLAKALSSTLAAPQAQADARDAVWLQPADMAALERFAETTDDDQSYDIGKDSVQRLSSFGCLKNCGFGRYEITSFGSYLLNDWERARILPFTTQADRDAAHRAAIAAAKGE